MSQVFAEEDLLKRVGHAREDPCYASVIAWLTGRRVECTCTSWDNVDWTWALGSGLPCIMTALGSCPGSGCYQEGDRADHSLHSHATGETRN